MLERMRIKKWPLFLECLQHELTYLPLTASFLGLWLYPDAAATWVVAPALMATGLSSLVYNFFLGKGVRQKLERRLDEKSAKERAHQLGELRQVMVKEDASSLDTILTLETSLLEKIKARSDTLELSGTFVGTFEELARDLAASGIEALRRKTLLQSTAAELREMGARAEAEKIEERMKVLDDRVMQVRQELTDSLGNIAVMDDSDGKSLESLSRTFEEHLSHAAEVTRDLQPLLASGNFRSASLESAPAPEAVKEPASVAAVRSPTAESARVESSAVPGASPGGFLEVEEPHQRGRGAGGRAKTRKVR